MRPLTLFVCALLLSPTVSAQDAPEQTSAGQVHWDQAIALYSERDYASAIPLIIEAIQADPTDPRYYRGLARSAHFADQFDLATRYYDVYLEHYAAHANSASGQDNDEAAIRRERDRANSRREAPNTPVELPPFQIAALDSLHQRLEGGPYLSADNTGAYAMFETLLRTGYAEPHLAEVREHLAAGLRDETNTLFLSMTASAVPLTTLDEWRRVPERLDALDTLGVSDLDPSVREARLAAARGQINLINANYDLATEEFTRAATADPTLIMACWGLVLAQHGQSSAAGHPVAPDAMALVDRLDALVRAQAPQQIPLLHLARAVVWYDMARHEEAASALLELLAPGRSPTETP